MSKEQRVEEKDHILQLFHKYLENRCTPEEIRQLYRHFGIAEKKELLTMYILEVLENVPSMDPVLLKRVQRFTDELEPRLLEQIRTSSERSVKPIRGWIWYAAAMISILTMGIYLSNVDGLRKVSEQPSAVDIEPGGYRAALTLANGKTITLSNTQEGIAVGDEITYLDGSSVMGETESRADDPSHFMTLVTPKGGTYQITLPDGTRVWLNAASALKYPSRFDVDQRVVELEGEAYFEVKHLNYSGAQVPFRVVSNALTVEVLGTQFNISAYPDEVQIRTTLVEGSVQVTPNASEVSPVVLKPGEQASTQGSIMKVTTVDIDQYTAWKNGRFYFKRTPLEDIMRQISRWYDVDVLYADSIPRETFSGKVSRNVSLMGLLDILQVSSINVRLEGKTLIIN